VVIAVFVEATIPRLAKKCGKRRDVQGMYKEFSEETNENQLLLSPSTRWKSEVIEICCEDAQWMEHCLLFISVFNQLDAQNLFHNKFYFTPLHVSSTCAHHQEVKIALHSLWYHHTYRCDDTRGCVMHLYTYRCDDTRGCVMQF